MYVYVCLGMCIPVDGSLLPHIDKYEWTDDKQIHLEIFVQL